LHIAPLALIWTIVVVHAWLHGRIRTGSRGSVDPAAAASAA